MHVYQKLLSARIKDVENYSYIFKIDYNAFNIWTVCWQIRTEHVSKSWTIFNLAHHLIWETPTEWCHTCTTL